MSTSSDDGLEALLRHVREERGFDFTGYKRASLARRVQRRMDALEMPDHEAYLDHLLLHPDEFTLLFNTVLINVTSFFRDPDAWAYLEQEVLPPLLVRRTGQAIRVWSAGCASGEEACTIAMILAEHLGLDEFRERVKIYATDVDEEALAQARQSTYTAEELEAVPLELREKYFEGAGQRFTLRKELRRSLIFGRNDLVQDAPISHIDILLCRNTMMYFNAEVQGQVLNRLHFAMRPDGVLFLGKAEMLLSHAAYFRPIELRQRLFSKVAVDSRDRRLLSQSTAGLGGIPSQESTMTRLGQVALMSSAAAQIVLDTEGVLVLANHRAMNVFGLSLRDLGQPIQDLEVSYRPLELRAHIDEAVTHRRPVWVRDVEFRGSIDPPVLDVQFVPLHDDSGAALGVTILFNDVTQYRRLQEDLLHANRQLETAYEELQSTNEELETTNEELQSTVEELETTNEELQSTNEELETMNEELQSMNDELHFSNHSMGERQAEVDNLNQFMTAVLGSLNAGLTVVDEDMTVLAWNTTAADLWGVRPDEAVGAHLLNLDIGLPLEQLRQPIRAQLSGASPEPTLVVLDAVNRRGRPVQVRVTVAVITDHGASGPGVVVVMEAHESTPSQQG